MLAEMTLQPVRLMRDVIPLTAVTVRTLSRGRRFNITITKTWPRGASVSPAYAWSVSESDETGAVTLASCAFHTAAEPSESYEDPEYAYWAAVEAISEAVCDRSSAA